MKHIIGNKFMERTEFMIDLEDNIHKLDIIKARLIDIGDSL